jgi:hypothetical protein
VCPACGGPLYRWVKAHPADARSDEEALLDRCESCGLVVARSSSAHPATGHDPAGAAERELERLRFAVDAVVTVLAALLVAIVSVPLEAAAAAVRRGGEMRVVVRLEESGQASSSANSATSSATSS